MSDDMKLCSITFGGPLNLDELKVKGVIVYDARHDFGALQAENARLRELLDEAGSAVWGIGSRHFHEGEPEYERVLDLVTRIHNATKLWTK